MARVTGPSRDELDVRGDQFATRVTSAIRATLRSVAADTRDIDDLTRILTLWRSTVEHTLMPRLRVSWNTAVQGVRSQLEKINERQAVTAAIFTIPKVSNPLAESFLAGAQNRLVGIGDDVWTIARDELLEGLQLGEGVAELRARVVASAKVSAKRAAVIARTEVNSAMNNGAYQQMKALDVATVKEWIATNDARTRESHAEVDGAEIEGNAKFMVGGHPMDHPHDLDAPASETINCRCTLAWEIIDEDDDDDLIEDEDENEDEDEYEDVDEDEDDYLLAAGDFDEAKHPRDGKGRFAEKAGGGSLPKGKKLKITHGLVHKKHEPGAIIAVNGSSKKRVVWDGSKYLLQEKDANGGWSTKDTAIKSKAYVRINEFDSEWHEPSDDGSKDDSVVDAPSVTPNTKVNEPKPGQKIKKAGASKSGAQPGDSLKITHGLVHSKHEAGDVVTVNGANDKRVVWDGDKYRLQAKTTEGKWTTEKTAIKSKAYAEINAYDSDWRVPPGVNDNDSPTADADDAKTATPDASSEAESFFDDSAKVNKALDSLKPAGPQPLTGYKKVGGQAGSNTGGLFQDPEGQKWYVKAPKTDSHARNEVLANRLYEAAGVKTPQVELASMDNGPIVGKTGLGVKSKIIDGDRNLKSKILESESYKKKVHEDFAVDAWLGNWDTVGLGYDNIITDAKGDPVRIDAGGALLFRAQGGNKGSAFGDKVDEIDSLRKPSVNAQAANVFADVTDDDIRKGVAKIEAITPEQIDAMVDDVGFKGKLSSHLKSTLKARRQDLIDRFGSDAPEPIAQSATSPSAAPELAPPLTYAPVKLMNNLTKVKSEGNAAVFKDKSGTKFLVTPQLSETHARNQILAASLYESTNVSVEETELVQLDSAKMPGEFGIGVKTKIITPSAAADVMDPFPLKDKSKKQIAKGFVIDAWLGNMDVGGKKGEKLVVDKNGDVHRTSVGGALLFHGHGGEKQIGDEVNELDWMRSKAVSKTSAKIFKDVTDDDIREGVKELEKLSPATIDALVDRAGFHGPEATSLKNKLRARRQDLINRFGSGDANSPAPAYGGVQAKSMFDLTKVKPVKNGAIFTDPSGTKFTVTPQQSEAHARNQFLVANLYNFTGVAVAETDLVEIDPEKMPGASGIGVKTKVITPSEHADVTDPYLLTNKSKEQIAQGFAIDAWLGNWNVAGINGENLVVDKSNNVFRTNLGGSLLFRANGGSKQLSDTVDEIDGLRNPNVNPTSAKIFANVTDDDIRTAVLNLEKLQPQTIDFIVDQSGFTGKDAVELKKKLKARRQDLVNRFGSMSVKPTVDPGEVAPSTQPTAADALGGTKTFTALQKAKVQSIFAKNNVKWYNKTNAIYDTALEVSKTHPDLTMGDALDIMDGTLKKNDKPFRTKVEKWLKTNAGMHHAIASGGSAPLGGTSSTTSPSTNGPTPSVSSPGKPQVEFATPLPRDLTASDADILQERMDKAWPPPWNATERAALKKYTGDAYVAINNCLRGIGTCTPATQSTINSLRKAMKPSTDTVIVHRKTNPSAFGLHHGTVEFANLHKSLSALVGKTFEDKGVTSTSIRKGIWHGLVAMEIEVPKGAKIAWVKRLSQHDHEDEIILAPGTRFEVISVENTPNPQYPGDQTQVMKLRIVVDEV